MYFRLIRIVKLILVKEIVYFVVYYIVEIWLMLNDCYWVRSILISLCIINRDFGDVL